VRGSVYQRCFCRDPETRRALGRKCPKLKTKGHAAGWFFRYDAPRGPDDKRRRPELGPFPTQKAAEEELAATLARLGGGAQVPDRSLLTGAYLDVYIKGKLNLKPRTLATNTEIISLYWKPALGYLRLVDLRGHHVAEAVREMIKSTGRSRMASAPRRCCGACSTPVLTMSGGTWHRVRSGGRNPPSRCHPPASPAPSP
jgi:hypothetical protein